MYHYVSISGDIAIISYYYIYLSRLLWIRRRDIHVFSFLVGGKFVWRKICKLDELLSPLEDCDAITPM